MGFPEPADQAGLDLATETLDSKRAQFPALAGMAFERMFGSDGQNDLVTFAEREERACTLTV